VGAVVAGSQLKPAAVTADVVYSPSKRAPDARLVAGAVPTASILGTQLHHHPQQQQQQQQPLSRTGSVSCSTLPP